MVCFWKWSPIKKWGVMKHRSETDMGSSSGSEEENVEE